MKLKWALNELKKYQDEWLTLDGTADLEKALMERDEEILACEAVSIKGSVEVDKNGVYYADLFLNTNVTLPSSRSLEPVMVPLSIPFSEIYLSPQSPVTVDSFTEGEIVEKLDADILDLQKPIEDAILSNKPTQVFTEEELKSDEMPSGNDWDVVGEDTHLSQPSRKSNDGEGDPRFAALKNLFKEDDE